MPDQDLGHLCRGRRIHISKHSHFGILKQPWSVVHFDLGVSWYCVRCLSCASWYSRNNIHYFCSSHLWCWWSLFCEYRVCTWIIFHNVTSEHDSSFVFLVLWFHIGILKMTDVHQCSKVDFPFALFVLNGKHLSCSSPYPYATQGIFSSFSHSLSIAAFASRIFIAWVIGINSCTKL